MDWLHSLCLCLQFLCHFDESDYMITLSIITSLIYTYTATWNIYRPERSLWCIYFMLNQSVLGMRVHLADDQMTKDTLKSSVGHQFIHCTYNIAWVTVKNDFFVTGEVICQWFSLVTSSLAKIIGKSPHSWPKKSLFMVTNVLFYFLHAILCSEHTTPLKSPWPLLLPLSPRTVFSDLALWRYHSWSVTLHN